METTGLSNKKARVYYLPFKVIKHFLVNLVFLKKIFGVDNEIKVVVFDST